MRGKKIDWSDKRIQGAILAILVLTGLALAGCAGQQDEGTPTPAEGGETTPTEAPEKISLTTAGGTPGGTGFAIMSATMSTTSQYYQDISYTIVPGGWIGNVIRVNNGELDMGHTTVVAATLAQKQKGAFTDDPKPENVRTVLCDQIEIYYYVVARPDFEYDTVGAIAEDEYGLKVTNQPKGTFGGWLWDTILDEAGMPKSTLKDWGGDYTRVTWGDAASLLMDGHVDAILAVSGKQVGWLEKLTATNDVKYVGVSQEMADKISERYGLQQVTIPAGTLPGQDREILAFKDSGLIIANKNVPDKAAYSIAKGIAEHPKVFKGQHAMLSTFESGEGMYETSPLPLHEGAEEAYTELGYK